LSDHLFVKLFIIFLLEVLIPLEVLDDLLILAQLMSKSLYNSWVYFRLCHLLFEEISESLAFLHVKRKLSLILLDLRELESLLKISKLSVALVDELVNVL